MLQCILHPYSACYISNRFWCGDFSTVRVTSWINARESFSSSACNITSRGFVREICTKRDVTCTVENFRVSGRAFSLRCNTHCRQSFRSKLGLWCITCTVVWLCGRWAGDWKKSILSFLYSACFISVYISPVQAWPFLSTTSSLFYLLIT